MTTVTLLAVNAISHAFIDLTKGVIHPKNIYLGFDTSNWLNSETTELRVHITLEHYELPEYLYKKFVEPNPNNPHSKLNARIYLTAEFSNCVLNNSTKEFEVLDGTNTLTLGSFVGTHFTLLETLSKGRPREDEDYNPIKLTLEQQLIIANDVLASINANTKQQVLDAAIVALNTTKEGNFCTTLSRMNDDENEY